MSLCACGCGQETGVIEKTDARKGWVKGEHYRFVNGHNARVERNERSISNFGDGAPDPHDWTNPAMREITEADIVALRDMDGIDAADVYDAQIKALAASSKLMFIQIGLICTKVTNRQGSLQRLRGEEGSCGVARGSGVGSAADILQQHRDALTLSTAMQRHTELSNRRKSAT